VSAREEEKEREKKKKKRKSQSEGGERIAGRRKKMSGKNLASALQNFRQLAAKNQRIKVKSAEQWAKVRDGEGEVGGGRSRRREEKDSNGGG